MRLRFCEITSSFFRMSCGYKSGTDGRTPLSLYTTRFTVGYNNIHLLKLSALETKKKNENLHCENITVLIWDENGKHPTTISWLYVALGLIKVDSEYTQKYLIYLYPFFSINVFFA